MKKQKTKKNPKGKKVKRDLAIELTSDEFAAKGKEAANLACEFREVEKEKKAVVETYSAKLKDRASRRDELLNSIKEGVENRTVECIEVKNYNENRVEFWHQGVMNQHREMTVGDRQAEIPLKDKKTKTAKLATVGDVIASKANDKAKWNKSEGARA